ncbi:MAG: ABC transporter ATP-binding protein [bacterium]|nr:ABC transporter ATP-binding protein [bacterium]
MSAAAVESREPAIAIEAKRLHVRHPGVDRDVLRDASLKIREGEILALVGPNGSGKSTLIRALGRDLDPRRGEIEVEGEPLSNYARRRLARRVARLPQDPTTPEGLTVEALVECGRHPHVGSFGRLGSRDLAIVAEALEAVEIADFRTRPLETLSGGERRRAWIAMAIAQEPRVLLLDEPTTALDLRHQFELLDLLVRLNRERGTTIVLSIHDLEHAAHVADRVAVLSRGRVYAVGPPAQVLSEETLLDVFRVESKISDEDGDLTLRILGPGDPIRNF